MAGLILLPICFTFEISSLLLASVAVGSGSGLLFASLCRRLGKLLSYTEYKYARSAVKLTGQLVADAVA